MLYQKYGKRIFDIFGATVLSIIVLPIVGLIAVLHFFFGQGSLIYRQERYGLHGKKFVIYKFRTMIVDADKMVDQLAHLNSFEYPDFKIKNDPRVTKLGYIVRGFCLDELPQLMNVLLGNMSLIGPRPRTIEVECDCNMAKFQVLPGITGPIQVKYHNSLHSWKETCLLENEYAINIGFFQDLKLFFKTIITVCQFEKSY